MADDKHKTGCPDRDRINVNKDYRLQSSAKALGVRVDQLRAAADAAHRHLGK